MSLVWYNAARSVNEFVRDNLSTQGGEVVRYEFPISDLGGSHVYSMEFTPSAQISVNGNSTGSNERGRYVDGLVQFDVWRLPTSGNQPDPGGALKMLSRLGNLFGTRHWIPYQDYGDTPTASTVGTVTQAIRIMPAEPAKEGFDGNPLIRRYTQTFKVKAKEVF